MENLPTPIFIAFGTIAAAIITSLIAILSIILSKEIKVSELRQNWIDSLRNEISEVISIAMEIILHTTPSRVNNDGQNEPELTEVLVKVRELKKNLVLVDLRLNPSEHVDLLTLVNELKDFNFFNLDSQFQLDSLLDKIQSESKLVLKNEWEVVKNGGNTFKRIKLFFNLLMFILIFIGCLSLFHFYM